jgi:hypothetical protein
MNEHADHRSALPLAVILPAAVSLLHDARRLEHQPRPIVGQLKPVLLGCLLVEVAHGEIGIDFSLEPTELAHHLDGDPPAARSSCTAPVDELAEPTVLHRAPHPPHVPSRHVQNLGRLDPRDLTVDRLQHHLLLRHHPGLPGHSPLDRLHRAAVAHPGRTSSSVYDPDISIVCDIRQ